MLHTCDMCDATFEHPHPDAEFCDSCALTIPCVVCRRTGGCVRGCDLATPGCYVCGGSGIEQTSEGGFMCPCVREL